MKLKSGYKVEIRVMKENNDNTKEEEYYVIRDKIVGLHLRNKIYDSRVVADVNQYDEELNHGGTPLLDIMNVWDEKDELIFSKDKITLKGLEEQYNDYCDSTNCDFCKYKKYTDCKLTYILDSLNINFI